MTNIMFPRIERGLLLAVALSFAAGCGRSTDDKWTDKRPKVYPAAGDVTYREQPLPNAVVVFVPDGSTRPSAQGRTDPRGHFTLTTFEPGDGAAVGRYRISITKVKDVAPPSQELGQAPPVIVKAEWLIPERYGNATSSDLTAEVATDGGKNVFTFNLKD